MLEILQTSVSITAFVLLMMIVIEFVNVKTQGSWDKPLRKNPFLQVIIAALLGVMPGCLGVYTVVSLFTHKIIGFGALVSAMIATSGDEAFMMFGLIPEKALIILSVSLVLAIVTGLVLNLFYKVDSVSEHKFKIHEKDHKGVSDKRYHVSYNFKKYTLYRGVVLFALILLGINLVIGEDHHHHSFGIGQEAFSNPVLTLDATHGHDADCKHLEENEQESHMNLPKIFFLALTLISIIITLTSSNHFIKEHVWNHVIKKHFLKIFLWTFATLLFIYLIRNFLDFDIIEIARDNIWLVLLLAVLIGIIPESGPHMIFISFFIAGVIPLSILLANSIVQDGHGSLPLFAEDKKAFFNMKLVNLIVGLLAGAIGIWFGF